MHTRYIHFTALPEVPPIPCHVHAGEVECVNGERRCVGHGKTEAYFFPPLDVPPYDLQLDGVKTRLGLRSDVTKDQVRIYINTHVDVARVGYI